MLMLGKQDVPYNFAIFRVLVLCILYIYMFIYQQHVYIGKHMQKMFCYKNNRIDFAASPNNCTISFSISQKTQRNLYKLFIVIFSLRNASHMSFVHIYNKKIKNTCVNKNPRTLCDKETFFVRHKFTRNTNIFTVDIFI